MPPTVPNSVKYRSLHRSMLDHAILWIAINRRAARDSISVTALARRTGLDPSSFNISKRHLDNRLCWPSTENLMQKLRVTNTRINAFVALAQGAPSPLASKWQLATGKTKPLLALPGFTDPAPLRSGLYGAPSPLPVSPAARPCCSAPPRSLAEAR